MRGVINDTTCEVSSGPGNDDFIWDTFTVYLLGENRCSEGDAESNVGNPCNAGTGNKHQREVDYSSPTTGLSFIRNYNSQIPIDFGLGHGWISNLHKRLEKFGLSMRLRRGNAAGDVFTNSAGVWSGPADTVYSLAQDATGYTLTHRDGSTERYGLNGTLLSEMSAVGRTTTYVYDTNGRLLAVTGPFGHVMSFAYNSSGRLQTVIDPSLHAIAFTYDAQNNLTSATYPDNTVRTYHYENTGYPSHALTGITDENGDRYATFGYSASTGKATLTQHAITTNGAPQETYSLVYTNATTTTVTDAIGNVETLTFLDRHGMRKLLSRTSQVDGKGVAQTWDANNNLDVYTDAEGHKTKYAYNATNQRISMIEGYQTPQARTTTYEYLSPSLDFITKTISASVAPAQQREVITSYNPNRTIASLTTQGYRPDGTPVARIASMLYNMQGQVMQINGPRTDVSDITLFEYYECTTGAECGQLKKITNALGHITTFDAYDAHGRVLQATDPNGRVTSYTYDLRGRVLNITAGARVTTYTYDDGGQLQSVTIPNGEVLNYEYDAAHNLRSITDNVGNKISYTYDLKGNRTTEETRDPGNSLARTLTRTHDLRNRIDTINAAGSITDLLFDAAGNLKQETDPNLHSTSHSYDPLNRLVETIDALSGATSYDYDSQDQLTQVQAANGATTTYVYDDLGNLLQQSSPDTGQTSYARDSAGNLLSTTDARGVTTSYTYDALNRLTNVSYPASSLNQVFSYDGGVNQKGRLTGFTDAGGTMVYTYNVHGERTGENRTVAGTSFVTDYGYDSAGQLETMVYPSSGRLVTYTRNALGRITAVSTTLGAVTTSLASQVQYLPFGPISGLTFGNGMVESRLHDQQYRPDVLTDTGGTSIRHASYMYDAAGNIDRIQDHLLATHTQDFLQDALDRFTSDSGDYGVVTYQYDAVGNRTQRKRDTTIEQTIAYVANSNRLNSLNGVGFTYDAAGNTLTDGVGNRTYTYDDTNRLVQVRVSGVLQSTYAYNAHGQRVKKVETVGAQRTVHFHYGENGELLGETYYNSANQKLIEREYIWLEKLPLAFTERVFDAVSGGVTSSQLAYLHVDHLGTPRIATDQAQRVVWQWHSDAFGIGSAEIDPDSDTLATVVGLRLPGQYYDQESGLHYNYFRDYDPVTGRYLEPDPIGLEGGINTYIYALNNPTKYSDPDGELSVVGGLIIIAGALLAIEGYDYYQFYQCVKTCGEVDCPEGDTRALMQCKAECTLRYKGGGKGSKGPNYGPIPHVPQGP